MEYTLPADSFGAEITPCLEITKYRGRALAWESKQTYTSCLFGYRVHYNDPFLVTRRHLISTRNFDFDIVYKTRDEIEKELK